MVDLSIVFWVKNASKEEEQMNKKALIFGGVAVAVVAIAVALVFIFVGGGDEYRSIKVFELNGTCTVTRGNDTLDAFKNMSLSSGDVFEVPGTGFARLKLDDDKYVYLEAGTKIELFATGTENDSKTRVFIERGSMMTEVKKKLSATSSYDIVTPNTTMSIRGTKTLTEVIEDVVTGHIKTSNAVLEGQVKIKAVKVKSDGTVVSVEKDLGAGEGNAFSSAKEELVSQEEMKSIADTGASASGITVEIVSEEEAEVVFDVATFEATFLENVKSILVADAESAAGEDGLSQEQIDEINSQLGEIIEAFNEISENSQQAFNATSDSETVPEETTGIIPDPLSDVTSETNSDYTPIVADDTTRNEGTTLVDGETNLITIGDEDDENEEDGVGTENDEENEDNDTEEGEDVADDEEDDIDEEDEEDDDDDDSQGEESEEERLAREEEERLAREKEERLAREEEERLAREEEERLAREEEERLVREEAERLAREEAERLEREAQEAAEREAQQSQGGSGSDSGAGSGSGSGSGSDSGSGSGSDSGSGSGSGTGGSTTSGISYEDSLIQISYSMGSDSTSTTIPVKVAFYAEPENGQGDVQLVSMSSLPTGLEEGDALPGCMWSEYSASVIPAEESTITSDPHVIESLSSSYAFTGWYTSEADAVSNNLSNRYTTYTTDLADKQLYPGISKSTRIILHNSNYDMGYVSFPTSVSGDIIRWDTFGEGVSVTVKAGATFDLPVTEPNVTGAVDHAYVKMKQAHARLFCYEEKNMISDMGGQTSLQPPDIRHYYLSGSTPANGYDENGNRLFFASDNPRYVTSEDIPYVYLEMYYVSTVEVRVADIQEDEQILVRKAYSGQSSDYKKVSEFYSGEVSVSGTDSPIVVLPGSDGFDSYEWKLTKTSGYKTAGDKTYDLYTFRTVYTGVGDGNLGVPKFSISSSSGSGSDYEKDLLCSYKTKDGELIKTFNSDSRIYISGIHPTQGEDEFAPVGVIDGRYIFTVQAVDWVYIDMDPDKAPDVENKVFAVGENHPYVIPRYGSDEDHLYKFAINPVDLITDSGKQPAAPFDFITVQGLGYGDENALKKFIYAPDDIIYPFYKLGGLRNTEYGTNACDVYTTFDARLKNSYAYIGVQGYKLAGYMVDGRILNFNEVIEQTYFFGNHPCVLSNSVSVMNMFDITPLTSNEDVNEVMVLVPYFTPISTATATLTYDPPVTGEDSQVDYTAQSSILENYTITLNNVDQYYLETFGLNLYSFGLDYARVGETEGFTMSYFATRIEKEAIQEQGSPRKYKINNFYVDDDDRYWIASFDSNGVMSLSTKLLNIAVDDTEALKLYPGLENYEIKNNIFIRGLVPGDTGSSDPVSVSTYRCDDYYVVPAEGEVFKYSCFVYGVGADELKFARVFTAADSFNTTPASPDGVTRAYYNSTAAARIMDMVGSDNYGWAYYGGVISPYTSDDSSEDDETFFGSANGPVLYGQIESYEKRAYRTDSATNIYTYLGSSFADGAGMLKIKPFTKILISNCNEAYIYETSIIPNGDDNEFNKVADLGPWESGQGKAWKTINQVIGQSQTGNQREIILAQSNYIYDVQDGFVYTSSGDGSGAIYVGTADYTVEGGDLEDVNAKDFRAEGAYLSAN